MGEDIVAKYNGQLADLKMNSKPLINLLTMMAEDYIRHAPTIVQVIEKHLATTKSEIKLPTLYLIDSIIKNVKKDYVELFTQNIVSTFSGVFEKVDEKTRGLLWKLRGTWSEHFPQKKLYAIDVRCHQADPKWPIMAQPPQTGSIHVNPRFLNRGNATTGLLSTEQMLSTVDSISVGSSLDDSVVEVQMRAQLLAKQKELLELQTKKVELELLQTKMQMEEKARRQKKEDESSKQIDVAVKHEQMLVGMAEMAKNRTEKLALQLSSLHKSSSSTSSNSESLLTKGYESSSDRELYSYGSLPMKHVKSEPSSSLDGSPSKKSKSSREKRDKSKTDKVKDRNDPKEKESRHRHRDKDRHTENKDKTRGHDRSRESRKTGGEWKDYNEAKRVSSNRTHRKKSGVDSDGELDIKDFSLKRSPSPSLHHTLASPKSPAVSKLQIDVLGESNLLILPPNPAKSPSNSSQTGETSSVSSGGSSPMKRRLPKEKSVEKDRKDKSDKNNDKPAVTQVSDPRLRKRSDKEKNIKTEEKNHEHNNDTPPKSDEWKDYSLRQQAVLKRSYRKPGIEVKEEPQLEILPLMGNEVGPGDVDFRFETHMDVDLRTEADGSGPEPPAKRSKQGKTSHGTFDDLFGHQDVDLRAGSSCWTQVKVKSESVGERIVHDNKNIEEEHARSELQPTRILRSPGPPSPANSVSSVRSTCDPLGRPLAYSRLPNDPEERKRSLDSRSSSIDPVEQFRTRHIERALQSSGTISDGELKAIISKAKEEHELGFLNGDQYIAVVKQIVQTNEASAMREVQQMQQLKGSAWQPSSSNAPNPWMSEAAENNIWSGFGPSPGPRAPGDFSGVVRFPAPNQNTWDNSRSTTWVAPNLPPTPRGPNPFEEAVARPMIDVDDLIPGVNKKELHITEQDMGRAIPIDKVNRQIRFYRGTAIVLMGQMSDDPRELSFQMDERPRTVLINNKPLEVFLGHKKKFDMNRVPHTLRIGTPGRELYIDDRPYEMFFGGRPVKVFLDKRSHTFQLLPPTPQVSVGQEPRYDLVAGRVNLTVDAVSSVPVYLDEKLQKIEICGEPVVLKFCNGFQTVTLNGRPFPTNFGVRHPFTVTLPVTGKHYLRFPGISPTTERAIQAFVNANYGGEWNDSRNNQFGRGRGVLMRGGRGRARPQRELPTDVNIAGPNPWISEPLSLNPEPFSVNPLDLLNNLFPVPSEPQKLTENQSYESEVPSVQEYNVAEDSEQADKEVGINLNVSDLVANLIKFGLLPAAQPSPEANAAEEEDDEDVAKQTTENNEKASNKSNDENETEKKVEEVVVEVPKPSIPPLPSVDVSFNDNLRERRDIAIAQIFTGVQCSQCGLRFPPDQTIRYSQHLDWHFRHNRREKANARKALSRKWYYDLSDWIQFEEIEDLEERAASLFENLEAENENDAKSPSAVLKPEDYTVLASCHEGAVCPQCSEAFESFFDEEREEWRLKNAKLDECDGDAKLYHPICYEDYLKSLVEESILEVEEGGDKENISKSEEEEDDEVLIIKEGKKEIVVMEVDIDLDDNDVEKTDVNLCVNEKDSILNVETKTDNIVNERENNEILNNGAKSFDEPSFENSNVQSPILIDEDSTFLPGFCDEAQDGVFGFALNSGVQLGRVREESPEPKIIYEPMKFDIPRIKMEPPDEEPVSEDAVSPDEFMSNLQPFLLSTADDADAQPMNIDLTEEDSTDAVDSGARLVSQIRTSIDGNLQHEESVTVPYISTTKIRINISGMFTAPASPPKDKLDKVEDTPQTRSDTGGEPDAHDLIKDDGSENNIISNSVEVNKDNPVELVFTEEMKRLKPRLVNAKLTNCPPRDTGKEESGLCVIC